MENRKSPSHASWESTLGCPLRCKHCGLSADNARTGELSTEEAKKMLLDLNVFGVLSMIISGGEFTFRKDWVEILKFSLSLFQSVRIITCGWLGEKLFHSLEKIEKTDNLVVSVSLDGMKENHDQRRGKGSFDRVLETIRYRTYIPKTVLTTVDISNMLDCPEILRLCLELDIPLWSIQVSLPAGRMKPKLFLGQKRIKLLAQTVMEWRKKFGEEIDISPDDCFANLFPQRSNGSWDGCHAGKRLITILNDGSITGCPTMGDKIFGNVKTDKLEDVWNSKMMCGLRNEKPQECIACGKCAGGCKAVSKLFNKQFCSIN